MARRRLGIVWRTASLRLSDTDARYAYDRRVAPALTLGRTMASGSSSRPARARRRVRRRGAATKGARLTPPAEAPARSGRRRTFTPDRFLGRRGRRHCHGWRASRASHPGPPSAGCADDRRRAGAASARTSRSSHRARPLRPARAATGAIADGNRRGQPEHRHRGLCARVDATGGVPGEASLVGRSCIHAASALERDVLDSGHGHHELGAGGGMIAALPVALGLLVVVLAGSVHVLRESVAAGGAAGPPRRRRRTATPCGGERGRLRSDDAVAHRVEE